MDTSSLKLRCSQYLSKLCAMTISEMVNWAVPAIMILCICTFCSSMNWMAESSGADFFFERCAVLVFSFRSVRPMILWNTSPVWAGCLQP